MRPARVPTLPAERLSTRRESNPPRRLGRPVPRADRPRVHKRASRPGTRFTTAHPGWPTPRSRLRDSSQAAEELNLAGRFWRPARSQIAAHIFRVTVRYRSGTFAFTARRAEPLTPRPPCRRRGGGSRTLVARLSSACSALELRLSAPGVRRKSDPAAVAFVLVPSSGIEPASPAVRAGAITRSATRAVLWPGWCPATGIVYYSIVREQLRCATQSFGDEESNLD